MDALQKLWEQIQQQYRNYHASTQNSVGTALKQAVSGGQAVGQNNPFNNQAFQAMITPGGITSQGINPNIPSGQYGNNLSGVFAGLLDKIKQLGGYGAPHTTPPIVGR